MKFRKFSFLRGVVCVIAMVGAPAQAVDFDLLLDTDLDADTGCTVTPVGTGPLAGFERRVRATVDPATLTVEEVGVAACAGGSFGAPTVVGGPHPVGLDNGVSGSDVVEFSSQLSLLRTHGGGAFRMTMVGQTDGGSDVLATTTGTAEGEPILLFIPLGIPALGVAGLVVLVIGIGVIAVHGRRRLRLGAGLMVLSCVAVAATFVVDGQVGDWSGTNPAAVDPADDSTDGGAGNDLRALFAAHQQGVLYLRVDATDLENQPPVTADDSYDMLEDEALAVAAPGVLDNDSDPDGDPITASLQSGPGNAQSFTLDPDGSFDYTPSADFVGDDTFTYVANDGMVDSAAATVTITVDPVNDAPEFTIPADADTLEDAGPQSLSDFATGISPGPPDESGQALTFNVTNNDNPGLFDAPPALSSDGTLSFTAADDANGTANISVELMDDGGTANGGTDTSAEQTFAINVAAVNDAPEFTGGADQNVLEDAGAQSVAGWATAISAGPPDESGQALTFNVTANDNSALFSAGPAVAADGTLSYTPAADANGTANVTVELMDDGGTANGGNDTSPAYSFVIDVSPVNDAPEFNLGADPAVLEDSGAQTVSAFATGIDAGAADESGQVLTFNIVGNDNATLFSAGPSLDAATGDLTFTPAADASGSANVMVELMDDGGTADGGSDTSATRTFTIDVTPVNDPPSFSAPADPAASDEDGGAQSLAWASGISPGPPSESGQGLDFVLNQTGIDPTLSFATPPSVDSSTGNIEYTAAADAYGSVSYDVTLVDSGGTANGGVDSFGPVAVTITVNAVNDPPTVATAPTVAATTNIGLDVDAASGLLANASDEATEASDPAGPAAPGTTLTVGNGANPPPTSTAMGGELSIDSATGAFTYNPPAGMNSGSDTFDYVVCDNGIPGPGACSAPVTATINLSGNTIWFIDAAASSAGDGRLATPFDSIAAFNAEQGGGSMGSPAAGDYVFLYSGSYGNGVALLDGQTLFGAGTTGVSFDAFTGISPPPGSAARPSLGGSRPVVDTSSGGTHAVGVADNNTLRGIDLGSTGGFAVSGTVPGMLTIDEVAVSSGGGLLDLDGGGTGSLNATFDSLASTSSSVGAVLDVRNFASATLASTSTTIQGSSGSGIVLQDNAVGSMFDLGALADLSVPSGEALRLDNTGTVTIDATSPSVSNGNGTALSIDNTQLVNFTFASVSATHAAGAGIDLANISGNLTMNGGALMNTGAGNAFEIGGAGDGSGGDASVTYSGTITNTGSGRSVFISELTGGQVTLAGAITESGAGIAVQSVDNGAPATIDFTGPVTANTATNTAVRLGGGNPDATIGFSGPLDIDTTSGAGFEASDSGVVTVTGTPSSVDTTTGVGVGMTDTQIGAAGMAFESVSVDGAANGIALVNTGTTGDFIVTGDGTLARNASGGTIQNTSDDGVYLEDAHNVVLQQMDLLGIGDTANVADITATSNDHAVESRGGGDITLAAVHIDDPIGTGWEAFDITGDNSIADDTLVSALDRTSNFNGLRVTNLDTDFGSVSITDSTFDHADPTPGDPANNGNAMVVVSARGTTSGTFNVDNSTFIGSRGTAITVSSGDTAGSTGTLASNIENSLFEVAHPINGQNNIAMQAIQGTTHNKLADGNTLRDVGRGASLSGQIIMQKSDTAVMDAEVLNNVVSDVPMQHGIDALSLSTSTGGRVDWEADGNTIFNVGRRGIFNSARGNEPDMDTHIRNNTVGRNLAGGVEPVGFDTLVQRGVEIDVQTGAFLQGLVTNNEVVSNTSGSVMGGLASAVMFVNVEEFPMGTATAHVSFDANTFTNQNGTGSPNVLARTRDSGLTKALDFNATVADGMSSSVLVEAASGSTVTVEDLSSVATDNPGVSTFNIGAGVADHGGDVPQPDF